MIQSRSPPDPVRMQSVAAGVIVAALAYAGSLPLQGWVPSLKGLLALDLPGNIHPTYYLRTSGSLFLGVIVGALVRSIGKRVLVSERALSWATGGALLLAVVLVSLCP